MSPSRAATASVRAVGRLLILAVALGIVASSAASAFIWVVDEGQLLLYRELPAAVGLDDPTWWLAGIVLLAGAVLVMAARRMPGATGSGALSGFHFDTPIRHLPSVLVAAFGTLAFGFALGPEAPLIVLGSVIGAIAMRRAGEREAMAGRLLGGSAAIGAVFGNPLITAFMLLEFAAAGMFPSMIIAPILLALASGYAMQVGVLGFTGFGTHALSVPGLPAYDTIEVGDVAVALAVAVVAALVAALVREGAVSLDGIAARFPDLALVAVAIVTTGALAVALAAGAPAELVLFSGSSGMAELVGETSLAVVVVALLAKAVAYAAALGGGFRGGPIFPATALGVGVAVAASLVLTGTSVTPLAAAAIGASAAAVIKLPATSALLGALLIGGAGSAVAPFAILGAVIGLVVRIGLDRRLGRGTQQAGGPGHGAIPAS